MCSSTTEESEARDVVDQADLSGTGAGAKLFFSFLEALGVEPADVEGVEVAELEAVEGSESPVTAADTSTVEEIEAVEAGSSTVSVEEITMEEAEEAEAAIGTAAFEASREVPLAATLAYEIVEAIIVDAVDNSNVELGIACLVVKWKMRYEKSIFHRVSL